MIKVIIDNNGQVEEFNLDKVTDSFNAVVRSLLELHKSYGDRWTSYDEIADNVIECDEELIKTCKELGFVTVTATSGGNSKYFYYRNCIFDMRQVIGHNLDAIMEEVS